MLSSGFSTFTYIKQHNQFSVSMTLNCFQVSRNYYLSQCMRFPTIWYVRPAKPQISLRIRAVWSEPLLVARVFYDCLATDWTSFGVSKLKRRLQRLVRVYTCQNATLLELSCTGSFKTHQNVTSVSFIQYWGHCIVWKVSIRTLLGLSSELYFRRIAMKSFSFQYLINWPCHENPDFVVFEQQKHITACSIIPAYHTYIIMF